MFVGNPGMCMCMWMSEGQREREREKVKDVNSVSEKRVCVCVCAFVFSLRESVCVFVSGPYFTRHSHTKVLLCSNPLFNSLQQHERGESLSCQDTESILNLDLD